MSPYDRLKSRRRTLETACKIAKDRLQTFCKLSWLESSTVTVSLDSTHGIYISLSNEFLRDMQIISFLSKLIKYHRSGNLYVIFSRFWYFDYRYHYCQLPRPYQVQKPPFLLKLGSLDLKLRGMSMIWDYENCEECPWFVTTKTTGVTVCQFSKKNLSTNKRKNNKVLT